MMALSAERKLRKLLDRRNRRAELLRAITGDGNGTVKVPGHDDWYYVRPEEDDLPLVVGAGDAPKVQGYSVWVGPDECYKRRKRILGRRRISGESAPSGVESHGDSHGPDGADVIYIMDWQIIPLTVYVYNGMTVRVNQGYVNFQGQLTFVSQQDIDMTGSIPVSGARYSLIRLDSSGTADVQDGSAVASYADLMDSDIPVCDNGYATLAFVRLYYGQTELSTNVDDLDVRTVVWGSGLFDLSGFAGFDDSEGDPVDVDATAAADGTSEYAARRDHRHHLGDHATEHESGGDDPIKLDDLAAPDDNTDLNASVAKHGLLPKLSGDASESLRGDGSWDLVEGAGGYPTWWIEGALSTGTLWMDWVAPYDCTIEKIMIYERDTGTANSTVIDCQIDDGGGFDSIFPVTTKPTLAYDDADKKAEAVPDTTTVAEGDIIRMIADSVADDAEDLLIILVLGDVDSQGYYGDDCCQGRLTLTSGDPVDTSDVTAATDIYFTPDGGDQITLYDGSHWRTYKFTEKTLSLSGWTVDTNYDIFGYVDTGELVLEELAWTNDTTRNTALTHQDGRKVLDGDATRRYLGTIRITDVEGECEDSAAHRFVWNYANRIMKTMRVADANSHAYATATWRAWNNNAGVCVDFVVGLVEQKMNLRLWADLTAGTDGRRTVVSCGYDVTNNYIGTLNGVVEAGCAQRMRIATSFSHLPEVGYHYYAITENAASTASVTFNAAELEVDIYG